jgi:hypothetical protein
MKINVNQILKPETDLEKAIIADPEFSEGLHYGKPRPGHPEGEVIWHVQEVLENVDKYCNEENRKNLRLIALIHDTFKFKVDHTKPKHGENHHAMIARRFAERFRLPSEVLDIIELHDEAYNSWQLIRRKSEYHAIQRAKKLIERLGDNIDLYLVFYQCDNETGDKERDNNQWFVDIVKEKTNGSENEFN